MSVSKERMAELLAKARASRVVLEIAPTKAGAARCNEHKSQIDTTTNTSESETNTVRTYKTVLGKEVTLNTEQEQYIQTVLEGKDVVLIGKAGTGKTTVVGVGMTELIALEKITPMSRSTKYLKVGLPSVAILSFTNKAVNNIRRQMPEDLKPHCLTIHKLLEFKPVKYEIQDKETGKMKITMRFEPSRNAYNPLPDCLRMIIIEESSMVSVELHQLLKDALPENCQMIYLGDIRQLPPVMGTAILGFKMLELPVIELTEVYRQALLSPILRCALAVDSGEIERFKSDDKRKGTDGKWEWPTLSSWNESGEHGSLKIQPWQKVLSPDLALSTAIKFMNTRADAGVEYYNPQEDIILTPYNKAFGTIELNKGIAQHLGLQRKAPVNEVIAGFQKHYLAVGDRVLYNKEDAFITAIARNDEYVGARSQTANVCLNRWGHLDESLLETADDEQAAIAKTTAQAEEEDDLGDLAAIERFMESAASEIEDRVTAASHAISIRYAWDDSEDVDSVVDLDKATEVNNLLGGYAITVHKAQGSEYDKVFLLFHASQSAMISRELLYTAITRAAKHLHIVCDPLTFEKGIRSQRIKGNTVAEKAEYFKGKLDEYMAKVTKTDLVAIAERKSRVATALLASVRALNAAYPNKPAVEIKEVTYVDKGSAAGTAYMGGSVVNINPLYLEWDEDEVLSRTVPHEVAHIFAYHWFKDTGHGTAWRQLCVEAGGTGDIYHEMGSARSIRSDVKFGTKNHSVKK